MAAAEATGSTRASKRGGKGHLGDALFLRITQLFALGVLGVVLLAISFLGEASD